MANFILLTNFDEAGTTDQGLLEAKLEQHYQGDYRSIGNGNYVVVTKDVTTDVSKNLDITDGTAGRYIVARVTAYFGYGPADLWEWLSQREDDDD